MSDFVQTMKDWRRMCNAQIKLRNCDSCSGCPLEDCSCLPIYYDVNESDTDYAFVEHEVLAWAADHPEMEYPTWGEWFIEKGILPDGYYHATNDLYLLNILEKAMQTQISADTAQKLGVKPRGQEAR